MKTRNKGYDTKLFVMFVLGIALGGISFIAFNYIIVLNCQLQGGYLIENLNDVYAPTYHCYFSPLVTHEFQTRNIIPLQDSVMKFCQEHGYPSGWINSLTCNGITCTKSVNEYVKYDCFGLDGEKK